MPEKPMQIIERNKDKDILWIMNKSEYEIINHNLQEWKITGYRRASVESVILWAKECLPTFGSCIKKTELPKKTVLV